MRHEGMKLEKQFRGSYDQLRRYVWYEVFIQYTTRPFVLEGLQPRICTILIHVIVNNIKN